MISTQVRTEVDENVKDLMEGQGTLEDALLDKLKAKACVGIKFRAVRNLTHWLISTQANTEADEERADALEDRLTELTDANEKRATELESAAEARANELTERIASEATARGEALSELQTSISAVKDELTDKIDDETSSRNQALDAVRNAAVGSQKAATEAQAGVDSLRKDLDAKVKAVEAKIPKAAAPAAPAADAPESSPGD